MKWTNLKSKLRKPQIDAIELIDGYLASGTNEAALIHMPTGSGKSGIVSVITNLQFNNCVLVLTPRVSLTNQIYNDIREDFFKVIKEKPNPHNKYFRLLNRHFRIDESKPYDKEILVTTIQKINWLKSNNDEEYQKLLKITKLIIFDEGHYEPAYSWSKTIRNFKVPKILFTATPFRNDLKAFKVSDNFIFPYSYEAAKKEGYLRSIEIIKCDSSYNDKIFIETTLKKYKEKFGPINNAEQKLIIRCSNRATIRRLAKYLNKHYGYIKIIGIHERFLKSDPSYLQKKVPKKIKDHKAKIWIHQNKLMEGVDDSKFQMLSIYGKFNNDRSLVQQIGRIVRQPKTTKSETAYVLDFSDDWHKNIWHNYLEFDKTVDKNSFKPFTEKVLGIIDKVGDQYEYMFNGFKRKFEFNNGTLPDDIKLPKQINLLKLERNFDLSRLSEFTTDRLNKEDRPSIHHKVLFNEITLNFHYYYKIGPTPFFANHYSINIGAELILYFVYNGVLFYYDSSNYLPIREKEIGIIGGYDSEKLKKIFNKKQGYEINRVSLKNSNLGTNSIRSHAYAARSIDNTISYLDDSSNIVSTVSGKYKSTRKVKVEKEDDSYFENVTTTISRYVGLSTGRISERSKWVSLSNFMEWIMDINKILKGYSYKPKDTFQRYSQRKRNVKKPEPRNILLDIEEIREDFKIATNITENGTTLEEGENVEFEDLCTNVLENSLSPKKSEYSFDITLKGNFKRKILITYDANSARYELECDELDELFEADNSNYSSIIQFLNKKQSFKVFTEEKNCI